LSEFEVHRRQFVISRQKVRTDRWKHFGIREGLWVSYHPELNLEIDDVTGHIFLGLRLLNGRAGRYITINNAAIYGCAGSLLPIYYGKGPDGPVVSSSPRLISDITKSKQHERTLQWGSSLNCYLSPSSPYAGIFRLFFDQSLNLLTLETETLERRIEPFGSAKSGIEQLAEYLVEFANALSDSRILVPLTAGLDSRAIFAAFIASGVKFETFTQYIDSSKKTDIRIAKKVSEKFNIRHHIIMPKKYDSEQLRSWKVHASSSY
jgi:hypothetical protein